MKKLLGAIARCSALSMVSISLASGAFAATGSGSGEQPAMMGEEAARQAPGVSDQDIKNEAVKMSLAPHAIAVETALMNAIDQVRGLKAQVRTAQNQPTSEFISQYKMHVLELKSALKDARTHEGDLKSRAGKFPSVARTEEYRQLAPAISEAERLSQQWEKQSASSGYWRDSSRASSDLEQLERRLSNALDKSKSFSLRMDIATVS